MAIYDYFCDKCESEYEVIKSIKDYDGKDPCPKCGVVGSRLFDRCTFHHIGAKVKDAYKCPALGKVIKSDKHRNELAKQLGVIEIGNEKPETIHKTFDKQREDKRLKAYEDI